MQVTVLAPHVMIILPALFALYLLNPGNLLMKNVLKLRYNLYKMKFTLKKGFFQNKT